MPATHRVPSTRGVTVALHDLGGDGPPLLFCHPTGFHGLTWAPLAGELAPVARCWSLDFRGHGDSTAPDDGDYDWSGMADDVLASVDHIADRAVERTVDDIVDHSGNPPDGMLAVGHSLGGAALALAELARPGTFAGMWLFEPIITPPPEGPLPAGSNPLAAAARKRRRRFPDRDAAYANYASKPPLNTLIPAALHAYVDHGFRDVPGGEVELKCEPEVEAAVFDASFASPIFPRLDDVRCPVTVAVGGDGGLPARLAPLVVDALPDGHLESYPELTHFGPMEDPARLAAAIRAALGLM
jgi:pimeloyl-ACP methyl ester carboxylesterase